MKEFFLLIIIFFLLVLASPSNAQSNFFPIPLSATINAGTIKEDWNPELQRIAKPIEDEHNSNDKLNQIKEALLERVQKNKFPANQNESTQRSAVDTPTVLRNFQGNVYGNSVPNDNDIAVSNSGYVVSMMNTSLFKYDLNTNTSLGQVSLSAFAQPLGNLQVKYDPKVIYDPVENKFVVVFLAGFTHTTSSIIIAFSQTEDPNGVWNLYSLPGNPLNDNLWSDFPMIALTQHELFITVNHLRDNEPWQTGWVRTVIWQINKSDGYSGNTLSTQLHSDVQLNGSGIRNLCPAKGGSTLYGPDIYFLSERNLDGENDSFFLVHVTDTIGSASQQFTVNALVSDVPYFVPINAKQPTTLGDLQTNDSRVLGAFIENDLIQFVGNTTDTSYGTSAFYHGSIATVSSLPALDLRIVSDPSLYFGYPNISYAGSNSDDQRAVIDVLRSSPTVNPGYSALLSDGDGNYSSLANVKNGLSYHNALSGTERWGDYSGSQRKYNEQGKVWVNGSYATSNHLISTWIAELSLTAPVGMTSITNQPKQLNLYPNPANDATTILFDVNDYTDCIFNLYDLNGRLIKTLLHEEVRPGKNQFSFSMEPIAAGNYLLVISSEGKIIASQKVVKQ